LIFLIALITLIKNYEKPITIKAIDFLLLKNQKNVHIWSLKFYYITIKEK